MQKSTGFTLIELMIVVAIVAILATVAYPSFTGYLLKSKRIEAIQSLYSMQLKQEDWRISHPAYTSSAADLISPTSNAHYSYSATVSGSSYTVTATAKGSQLNDKEGATSCSPLTLGRDNSKTPAACWQ
ncbi:type IV pilus assembly protein PilE [Oceanisphaera litoralis]|uniref:type IV pilin protein n=1 Tax=Oceanisphaera litoralis TaxID=225144 RepID=UPI00195EF10A|nr:type IV pilin protein [Oceanisphaera litoralis]MBM7456924.1 type IV pilus assembly protein PilE [Oceanisphaera litoralis]